MNNIYTPPKKLHDRLGKSFKAFQSLIRFVRVEYEMDELWNGSDNLKFRRGGKTLVSIGINDNKFNVLIIFGKAEREKFEIIKNDFSSFIRNYYDNSRTYHDGKWMFIDVEDDKYLNEMFEMLKIKRKPNRKINISKADFGQCGNRCDQCLLYAKNNETSNGSAEFNEKDWICHHSEDEERADYSKFVCVGCHNKPADACPEKICLQEKGYNNCLQCSEYNLCNINSHDFDPARCNIGISADDITRAVLPYYCNFWLDVQKK